jgi:hypothetical protein
MRLFETFHEDAYNKANKLSDRLNCLEKNLGM